MLRSIFGELDALKMGVSRSKANLPHISSEADFFMVDLQPLTPPVRPLPIAIVSAEPRLTEVISAVMKQKSTFGCWERAGDQAGNYICMTYIPPRNLLLTK